MKILRLVFGTLLLIAASAIGLLALIPSGDASAIQACKSALFPSAGSPRCEDWHATCDAADDCRYDLYWQARYWEIYKPTTNLFAQLELAMRLRHVHLGWTDIDNPEHVAAVDDDWAEVLRLYETGGLPAVAAHAAGR